MSLTMAFLVQLNQQQFVQQTISLLSMLFLKINWRFLPIESQNTHLNQTSSASSNVICIGKQWRDEKFEYVATDTYIAMGLYIAVQYLKHVYQLLYMCYIEQFMAFHMIPSWPFNDFKSQKYLT